MMAPSFISEVGALSPQRKHRPLAIIDENHRGDVSENHEFVSVKMKDASGKHAGSQRSARRLAVAPLQHPVFDLLANGVGTEKTNQENRRDGDFVSIIENTDTRAVQEDNCDKLYEDKKVNSSPPQDKKRALDTFTEVNCLDYTNELRSTKHENEDIEKELIENKETSTVCFLKGLDKSSGDNDNIIINDVFGVARDSKLQAKQDFDKDIFAWKKKIKESVSLPPLLPNKFRPLRRSVGNYNAIKSGSLLSGESSTGLESCDLPRRDSARFFLDGQKPDYPINPNTLVTKPPGQSRLLYGDMTKLSSVVRKYSLQERIARRQDDDTVNNHDDARLAAMAFTRKTGDAPFHKINVVESRESPVNVHDENAQESAQACDSKSGLKEHQNRGLSPTTDDQKPFRTLKETAARLKLSTRRASTAAWKAQYVDGLGDNGCFGPRLSNIQDDGRLTQERKDNIDKSLEMLRQELMNIDQQDQELAKQFLAIRTAISQLRWNVLCRNHERLLEDVEDDIQDVRALSRLVDAPTDLFSTTSFLRHVGLTRMNITSRKFSTC